MSKGVSVIVFLLIGLLIFVIAAGIYGDITGTDLLGIAPGSRGLAEIESRKNIKEASSPIVSSDEIVFEANKKDNFNIWSMDFQGKNVRKLTGASAYDAHPSVSSDGRKIVFISNRHNRFFEIYTKDLATGDVKRLTNNRAFEADPSFSPFNDKIVFVSGKDGDNEIYTMDSNGNNWKQLTDDPAWDAWPSFSPDGSKIVFGSKRTGDWNIYIMYSDGRNLKQLTDNPASDSYPSFSPDGTKILFRSSRTGIDELFTMNIDGSNQQKLTDFDVRLQPIVEISGSTYSGDGSKIIFRADLSSELPEFSEIYIMDSDGNNLERLTDNSYIDNLGVRPVVIPLHKPD